MHFLRGIQVWLLLAFAALALLSLSLSLHLFIGVLRGVTEGTRLETQLFIPLKHFMSGGRDRREIRWGSKWRGGEEDHNKKVYSDGWI